MCGSSSGPLLSESGNVLQCEQCLVDSLQHPQLKCRWQFQTQIVRLYVLNLSTHFDQIFLSAQKFRLQFSNNSPNIVNPNQCRGLLCFSGKTRSWLFFLPNFMHKYILHQSSHNSYNRPFILNFTSIIHDYMIQTNGSDSVSFV